MARIHLVLNSTNNEKCNEAFLEKGFATLNDQNTSAIFLIGDGLQIWNLLVSNPKASNEKLKELAQEQGDTWWNKFEALFIDKLFEAIGKIQKMPNYKGEYCHTKPNLVSEFASRKTVTEKIATFNRLAETYGLKAKVVRWEDFINDTRELAKQFLHENISDPEFLEKYRASAESYTERNLEKFKKQKLDLIDDNEQLKLLFEEICNIYLRLINFYEDKLITTSSDTEKNKIFKQMLSEFYSEIIFEQMDIDSCFCQEQSFLKAFVKAYNHKNTTKKLMNLEDLKKNIDQPGSISSQYEAEETISWSEMIGKSFCKEFNVALETISIVQVEPDVFKSNYKYYSSAEKNRESKKKIVSLLCYNNYYLPIFKGKDTESFLERQEEIEQIIINANEVSIKQILFNFINIDELEENINFVNNEQNTSGMLKKTLDFFNGYFEEIKSNYKRLAYVAMKTVLLTSSKGVLMEESPTIIIALDEIYKNTQKNTQILASYPGYAPMTLEAAADLLWSDRHNKINFINTEKEKIPWTYNADSLLNAVIVRIYDKLKEEKQHAMFFTYCLMEVTWKYFFSANKNNNKDKNNDTEEFNSILLEFRAAIDNVLSVNESNKNPRRGISVSFPAALTQPNVGYALIRSHSFIDGNPLYSALPTKNVAEAPEPSSLSLNARIGNESKKISKSLDDMNTDEAVTTFLQLEKKARSENKRHNFMNSNSFYPPPKQTAEAPEPKINKSLMRIADSKKVSKSLNDINSNMGLPNFLQIEKKMKAKPCPLAEIFTNKIKVMPFEKNEIENIQKLLKMAIRECGYNKEEIDYNDNRTATFWEPLFEKIMLQLIRNRYHTGKYLIDVQLNIKDNLKKVQPVVPTAPLMKSRSG